MARNKKIQKVELKPSEVFEKFCEDGKRQGRMGCWNCPVDEKKKNVCRIKWMDRHCSMIPWTRGRKKKND